MTGHNAMYDPVLTDLFYFEDIGVVGWPIPTGVGHRVACDKRSSPHKMSDTIVNEEET